MANHPGADALIAMLEDGMTYREIAAECEASPSTVHAWLNAPDLAERSARAREDSAEAWLDRGLEVVASALDKNGGVDSSAARAYAQECARRAAIRNPRYRDSAKVEATVSGNLTISRVERVIVDAAKNPADQDG